MSTQNFSTLILIARPAAGKSEIIHYLKRTPPAQRQQRFHMGELYEIDDFPMLWSWFEEDTLLSEMGKPRLYTDENGNFKWQYLWDLLIQRISLEYKKHQRDNGNSADSAVTTLIEFARGKEHGGYRGAFQNLSAEILQRATIVYIQVSYAESLRKNRRRFNPERPDSILEHGLSDEKMEKLYREMDWDELAKGQKQGYLEIQGYQVPFVEFENEDDVTTPGGEPLGKRLEERLNVLWQIYQELHAT
ncbi:MAG: hypothetical protein P8Z00_14660 [Anaerolineales bacterium]